MKLIFLNFRIVEHLLHKSLNKGIKISLGCGEMAFCLVRYFLSHLVAAVYKTAKMTEATSKLYLPHLA